MIFKAAMFDFDGTITDKGHYYPAQKMADALFKLSQKVPIAFCTGRQLESFEKRAVSHLLEEIEENNHESFLKNLFLFAENGALGYNFNLEKNKFENFYQIDWPEYFFPREELMKILNEKVKKFGEVYYNAHKVVVVIRTILHGKESRNISEVYKLSDEIYKIVIDFFSKFDEDYEEKIHVGNSGIGVVIGPADGDKDIAIKKFAEYLRENRGLEFNDLTREILVVGDSALKGGNDYFFLKGTYGTPYCVGDIPHHSNFPLPVINGDGERLSHAEGTFHLINNLQFSA